jgi:hypothetical protein
MANNFVPVREPERFAAGDTLIFQKYFPAYLPNNGWALTYTLTDANSGKLITQVVSASPDNTNHLIDDEGFAANKPPGQYILSGEAINAGTGEAHQIYYGPLTLTPDLEGGQAPGPLLTEAQTQLQNLMAQYTALTQQIIQESDINRTRMLRKKQSDVLTDIKYWKERRFGERRAERARNGEPDGSVTQAVLAVM